MQSTTMLFVSNVEASSKWFQEFLGVTSGHGGPEFEMLMNDGDLFLQLHLIGNDHDHEVSTAAPLGHGVVIVVYIDDAKTFYEKALGLDLEIISKLHFNEIANMHEFVVREPNGYSLMVCQSLWTTES